MALKTQYREQIYSINLTEAEVDAVRMAIECHCIKLRSLIHTESDVYNGRNLGCDETAHDKVKEQYKSLQEVLWRIGK